MSLVDKIFKLFKKSENVDYKHYADCIIFDVFGNLLLLQRSTQNDFQGGKWGLPGGKVEEDELEDTAAARELEEETGLKVKLDYLDTVQKENCEISYYLGFLTDNIQLLILDNDEHYHYQFVPLDELDNYDLLLDLKDTLKSFPLEGFITDNLAELPVADRIIKKVSDKQIKNLLNKGLISDEDYFNFIQINKAISDIKKGFDLGIVEDEKYLQAIQKSKEYELIKVIKGNKLFFQFDNIEEIKKSEGGNPSHGGKLIKVNKVDKNGNKTTKWIKHEDLKNEISNDEIHIKEKSYSDKELKEHAKNASEAALKDTIANHTDPKIRKTAHEELDRRSKQEAVREDGNENGQKNRKKQEENNNLKENELSKEINGYKQLKNIEKKDNGYIKTNETITDDDYEEGDVEYKRTKAYKLEYVVNWADNETNSDPDIEKFTSIDEAYDAAQLAGDWWNWRNRTFKYYSITIKRSLAIF